MTNKLYSYGKQSISQEDIDVVAEVLKGDWLTQGPYVKQFEQELSEKFSASYATAVSNGTAALHLIALALGWKKGDVVITTPITFLASANCIVYAGATPDFVDIDAQTYTIDVDKLEEKILSYIQKQIQIKAVVAVDYAGLPCNWKKLRLLADTYNFQLVNDNCHALGAAIDNSISYACQYADVVAMSFHPVKHITTGEGGAILTNNKDLDEKVKILRTHGMTKDVQHLTRNDGPWYYEMHELGYNYRITDFQCALGSSQLRKLDKFIQKRTEIANWYNEQFFDDERFIVPYVPQNYTHAYHLYPLQIKFEQLSISKKDFFERMKENNIILQVHYIPVHTQPYYKKNFGFSEWNFPVAERFYLNEVSIPIYPLLEKEDVEYIAMKIKQIAK